MGGLLPVTGYNKNGIVSSKLSVYLPNYTVNNNTEKEKYIKILRLTSGTVCLYLLFTIDEWVFMINTFNSTLTDEMFCANKGAFIACCEDAEKYEGGATILNMDLSAFINKINSLKGANIEAIYSRIKDYWSHSNEIDLNEWAKF